MIFFNNGYLVKGLFDNPYESFISLDKSYRGLSKYFSWPLSDKTDEISKRIESEAAEKYFYFEKIEFWLVQDRAFLLTYVNHCKKLGLQTIVLKIETTLRNQKAVDNLEEIEILGFDLADNVDFSYLFTDMECIDESNNCPELELFNASRAKLNKNKLFDSYSDAIEHLEIRNRLLAQGINLEYSDKEIYPVRLSIVKL